MSDYNYHNPVLANEVVSLLPEKKKITYLDRTLGRGGHASLILKKLQKGSAFYGIDRDRDAIDYCKDFLQPFSQKVRLNFLHSDFASSISKLRERKVKGADFILMDIGVSSPQFDDPSRGFSYRYDAPLDRRRDQEQKLTAKSIVNGYSEKELCRVFGELGQCHIYYPVVKAIRTKREIKPIETTFELVDIIKENLPQKELRKEGHPAKQFFLGLRYEVNGEREQLKKGLKEAISFLNPKGRLVVISFNSEEDKRVKDTFNSYCKKKPTDKYLPRVEEERKYELLTKKPIRPNEEEIEENNRTKPAILRARERR